VVITFPADALPIALTDPDRAAARIASVIVRFKPDAYRADAETQARQIVDEATRADAFLLAITAPPGADPAVLTGMSVTAPPTWTPQVADRLRWSLADVAGDTTTVHTAVGPAVLVERTPPARPRQLQAFLPDDDTSMLLLTLSTISARGWPAQRELFVHMVASATHEKPN
jgi:hypothetical protein